MSMFNAFLSDDETDTKKPQAKDKKPQAAARKPAAAPAKKNAPPPAAQKPRNDTRPPRPTTNRTDDQGGDTAARGRPDRGRGRGRGRGTHRPGETDARGKRYFDRQSGSGRGREIKKGGAGGHNWGQQIDAAQYNTNVSLSMDATTSAEKATEDKPAETANGVEDTAGEAGEKVEAEPEEPEVPTFTLEEYQSKHAEKRVGDAFKELDDFKAEKIDEGREYSKKNSSNLDSEEAFIAMGDSSKSKAKKKGQNRASQRKMVDDIGFTVKDPERSRGGFRGGRGGGRGRGTPRGRGGYGRGRRVDMDTNDQQNFPQLGA